MVLADERRRKLLRYCVENGVCATGRPLVRQICVGDTGVGVLVSTDDKAEAKVAEMAADLEGVGVGRAHAAAVASLIYRTRVVESHTITIRQLQCKHGVLGTPYSAKRDHEGIGTAIGWRDDIEGNLDRLPDCRKCSRAAGIERGSVVRWLRRRDWKWLTSVILGLAGLPR